MGGMGINLFNWYFQGCIVFAIDKEVFVEASLLRQGAEERRIWDVRFIRDFSDWELDEGLHFLRILGAITPMDAGDRMRWKWKPNGAFDIRSYYNKLRDSPSTVFPWKAIWRAKALRRVSFLFSVYLGIRS